MALTTDPKRIERANYYVIFKRVMGLDDELAYRQAGIKGGMRVSLKGITERYYPLAE